MIGNDRRVLPRTREAFGRSEAGATHPALPAVVLLVSFAVFMAAIAPLDFGSIIRKFFPVHQQAVPHQDAAVWVDNTGGVYYCADSIMFGKAQGEYMKQVQALDRGYQPALGTYCTGPAWPLPSQIKINPKPANPPAGNPFEEQQNNSPNSKPPANLSSVPR